MNVSHEALGRTIESIHTTIRAARSLRNAALLRNLTDYCPILHEKEKMVEKSSYDATIFGKRDELQDMKEDREGSRPIETSQLFKAKENRFVRVLSEIEAVAKSLQHREHTIPAFRGDLKN